MEQIPESITIKVHQSFESARPTWAALEQKGQWYPFQSYAWLETWYKTIGRANGWELCITELRSAACTMLFPLGIKTQKRHAQHGMARLWGVRLRESPL